MSFSLKGSRKDHSKCPAVRTFYQIFTKCLIPTGNSVCYVQYILIQNCQYIEGSFAAEYFKQVWTNQTVQNTGLRSQFCQYLGNPNPLQMLTLGLNMPKHFFKQHKVQCLGLSFYL